MNNQFLDHPPSPGKTAARIGIVAGVSLILLHIMAWLITQDVGTGDALGWLVSWLVLFMAARAAATRQREAQQSAIEPLQGTQAAGVGAALITIFILWLFIIIRNLSGSGDPFTNVWGILRLPVDLFLALGLGAWGGRLPSFDSSGGDKPFYGGW